MDKISPCLWFNFNAEEAVDHYLRVFKRGRVVRTLRYGKEQPELAGKVLMIEFELEGRSLQALNGGPQFQFNEAISLSVSCDSQAEVDDLWTKLVAGGSPSQCGWLKDRFGVSWQIVPQRLMAMLNDADAEKALRAMKAMMTMGKIDIAAVEKAFAGR